MLAECVSACLITTTKKRAKAFALAIWKITEGYSKKLEDDKRIDFDAMNRLVEEARYKSPYSLILVDELRDISDSRASLIKALKHRKPFSKIFAVGDDWQSIYRFAGSDISIFTQFEANSARAGRDGLRRPTDATKMKNGSASISRTADTGHMPSFPMIPISLCCPSGERMTTDAMPLSKK